MQQILVVAVGLLIAAVGGILGSPVFFTWAAIVSIDPSVKSIVLPAGYLLLSLGAGLLVSALIFTALKVALALFCVGCSAIREVITKLWRSRPLFFFAPDTRRSG